MTTTEFCYWLQGFFEIRDASGAVGSVGKDGMTVEEQPLSVKQVEMIRQHLELVFSNITAVPDQQICADTPAAKDESVTPAVRKIIEETLERRHPESFDRNRRLC